MRKVIAHTIFAPGHTYPFISLLRELKHRGFDVTIYVHTAMPSTPAMIGGVRVKAIQWNAFNSVPLNEGGKAAEGARLHNLERTGEALAEQCRKWIAVERPHAVLVDPMLWGSMVAAEASGLPWASVSLNPLTIRGRGLDARGGGQRPAHGLVGRLKERVVDIGLRASMLGARTLVNDLRVKYGLAELADFRDRYLTAPLIIATTAEPFEYPRSDWPSSMSFVGPLLWEPQTPEPAWIRELDERPLLLLAGTTVPEYRGATGWIRSVFDAVADEPVQLVATLPTDEVTGKVPDNCRVTSFVSHTSLLRRSQCVICHGGYGITAKALAAGVPVVAIPRALDRFEVARRLEVAEAGVMLAGPLSPQQVRDAIQTALARKVGAERVAEAFRRAGGATAAADAVAALL